MWDAIWLGGRLATMTGGAAYGAVEDGALAVEGGGRMASDVPHRRAMRSWPKALGNRLYGSLSARFGITRLSAKSAKNSSERSAIIRAYTKDR